MNIQRARGHYSEAELQCLEWLGHRARWLTVHVERRSSREFDLRLDGEYDGDDGFDYKQITGQSPREAVLGLNRGIGGVIRMERTKRAPKVVPRRFSGWLPLAALREFWAMGLHSPLHGDWSFTRDMLEHSQWAEFHRIVELARSKPVFSENFMRCAQTVWQSINEDSEQFAENADAVECVLDADRLAMLGTAAGKAANEELKWLDERFGPQRVAKELESLVAWVA